MFDHVAIRVSDRAASEGFYAAVLRTLGIEQTWSGEDFTEWNDFSLAQADDERPATRRLHIAFAAPSREHVDAFWREGTQTGHRDDGAPGPRPQYREDYYGAFPLDPDGNSVEAVNHGAMRPGIDHLWLRVADVAASTGFYETIAPHAGLRVKHVDAGRTQLLGDPGSFSLVGAEPTRQPTQHVHLAFPARDDRTVAAFHRAATGAGYRDNGGPGERPVYHEGYVAAFVLDPDGNNVEVVNHNR